MALSAVSILCPSTWNWDLDSQMMKRSQARLREARPTDDGRLDSGKWQCTRQNVSSVVCT